jgi:hypothetical protein
LLFGRLAGLYTYKGGKGFFFLDLLKSLFLVAAALFHAAHFLDDRGFLRHFFSALLDETTAACRQSLFHQGRLGSLGDLEQGAAVK